VPETRTLEELKRKSEQGSQQLQGEAQEILMAGHTVEVFVWALA
jgi:hypothetical protein